MNQPGSQQAAFDQVFDSDFSRWQFHDTKDPLTRYLRDRRLDTASRFLYRELGASLTDCSVLVVCGGVGGEATYFCDHGFGDVTNSDFSQNGLEVCRRRDPRPKNMLLDAEAIDLPDGSFDIVVVQDGLHHLPRPVLGFNEMIRVARKAVVVLEPHESLVAKLIGTKWERHGQAVNYVFRWTRQLFQSVVYSQLLEAPVRIHGHRLWDHSMMILRAVRPFGGGRVSLLGAKVLYGLLSPFNFLGNSFVGVLVKR